MNSPLLSSSKVLVSGAVFVQVVAAVWLLLKETLQPRALQEPACSARYAMLQRQQQWATRLFWLATVVLGVGLLLGMAS
ncbi:hypothetical protein [Hymenobacter oligotrophus]|uniref:hypothetical protein n=1 Tax=Hymenobacter oligotrophus TaxID=2319843 RepID=UPI0013C335AC|nr:hypothetical protein [Hymenobacter oligotrophus]